MSDAAASTDTLLDRCSVVLGEWTAWLTLIMVLVTFVIVVLRYLFDTGFIWLQESLTWMHAAVFMLGAAYTLQQEEHVRVDIFYRGMSARRKAIVNICGVLLFLLPMCIYLLVSGIDYAAASWRVAEESRNSNGLPYPAVPILKTILIVMPATVLMQGVALLLRSAAVVREH